MEIKLSQLLNAYTSLERLSKIKGLTVWKEVLLSKIAAKRAITTEQESLEAVRKELVQEFVKKDESGNPVVIDNKYQFDGENEKLFTDAFSKYVSERENTVLEVKLSTFKLSDFDSVSKEAELAEILEGLYGVLINED